MTGPPDNPPEKREPLAALHTYRPLPTHKIFPAWEWLLKFGWIGALAVAGAVAYGLWKPAAPVVTAPHFAAATEWTSGPGLSLSPAISRDGKLVAYSSDRESSAGLAIWTRPFDSGKPVRLSSGEFNDTDPDFSPDARRIAYRSERDGGGVYVQPAAGGAPALLARNGWKPRFSPDGKWVAYFTLSRGENVAQIFIVSSEGGEPRRIQPAFPYARYPVWAPDARRLLFTGTREDGVKDWWVAPIDGGRAVGTHAVEWIERYLKWSAYPDQWQGERIYFSGSESAVAHLWELPISPSTMQVIGPPRRLTDGTGDEQQIAVGPGRRLLFARLRFSADIWSLPIDAARAQPLGPLAPLSNDGARAQLPAISADGSRMVYLSDKSGVRDVWIADPNGKASQAVTSLLQIGYRPLLSPDGKRLVYPVEQSGRCAVRLHDLSDRARSTELEGCFNIWDWSSDGSSLLTFESGRANTVELMKISGGERRTVLSHAGSNLLGARFSPDARWIAFADGPTGARSRVFIAPLRTPPAPEREWIAISPDNSGEPAWSPDGSVLYFRAKRDGYQCIWAQKVGPGKLPSGEPIAILHLHSSLGINFLRSAELGIAVAKDRLTLNLGRTTGSLWTATLP